jgi:hypothetical protein
MRSDQKATSSSSDLPKTRVSRRIEVPRLARVAVSAVALLVAVAVGSPGAAFAAPDEGRNQVADVNGDGRADLVGWNDASAWVELSTGSGFSAPQQWAVGIPFYGSSAWGPGGDYPPVDTVGPSITTGRPGRIATCHPFLGRPTRVGDELHAAAVMACKPPDAVQSISIFLCLNDVGGGPHSSFAVKCKHKTVPGAGAEVGIVKDCTREDTPRRFSATASYTIRSAPGWFPAVAATYATTYNNSVELRCNPG